MKSVAIIPVREGSKRVPGKNKRPMCGKPLVAHVIEAALGVVDEVWVSTDDTDIGYIAGTFGAKYIHRPKELATDESPVEDAIRHFCEDGPGSRFDVLALVQATTPLQDSLSLRLGIEIVSQYGGSAVSVVNSTGFYRDTGGRLVVPEERKRSQDFSPLESRYKENGAFYITTRERFLEENKLLIAPLAMVVMPKWRSLEIDTPEDWKMVEAIMRFKDAFEALERD